MTCWGATSVCKGGAANLYTLPGEPPQRTHLLCDDCRAELAKAPLYLDFVPRDEHDRALDDWRDAA